jgi:molecular chaperone GrpE
MSRSKPPENTSAASPSPARSASSDAEQAAPAGAPAAGRPANSSGDAAGAPSGALAVPVADAETSELEALRRELAELRDKNLRLLAETRNLQQRAQREKSEALKYAEADFARELLVVLDDLVRTQESAQSGADAKAIADGVRIVQEHFLKVLKSRAVEPIEACGKPFDPHVHEALLQQPSTEHAAGMVIQELARGYKMHERVLRPARVIVSQGPPVREPAAPAEGSASGAPAPRAAPEVHARDSGTEAEKRT